MHQSPRSPETGPARRARTSPAKESATAVKTFGGRSSASRPAASDRFAGWFVATVSSPSSGGQGKSAQPVPRQKLSRPASHEDHPARNRGPSGNRRAGRRLPEELPIPGAPGPELPVDQADEDDSAGDRERPELEGGQRVQPADVARRGFDSGDDARLVGVIVGREEDEILGRRRGARLRSGGGQGLLPARRQGGSELDPPEPSPTRAVPGPEAVLSANDHEVPPSIRRRHREKHWRAIEVQVALVVGMDLVGPAETPARRIESDETRAVIAAVERRERSPGRMKRVPRGGVERTRGDVERGRRDHRASGDPLGDGGEAPAESAARGIDAHQLAPCPAFASRGYSRVETSLVDERSGPEILERGFGRADRSFPEETSGFQRKRDQPVGREIYR